MCPNSPHSMSSTLNVTELTSPSFSLISWALPNFLAHFSFPSFTFLSIQPETQEWDTSLILPNCYFSWPYLLRKPFRKSSILDKLSTSTSLCPSFPAWVGIISRLVYAEFILISFPKSHIWKAFYSPLADTLNTFLALLKLSALSLQLTLLFSKLITIKSFS